MKTLIALFVILSSSLSFAVEEGPIYRGKPGPRYYVISDSIDRSVPRKKAVYSFEFTRVIHDTSIVSYAIDGGETKYFTPTEKKPELKIVTTPGKHNFQFYLDSTFKEVEIDSLEIEKRHLKKVRIFFRDAIEYRLAKKPVIYLYPEDTIDVSIDVKPEGEFIFTYPNIENGWDFTCTPEGEIKDGDQSYRYLFWESKQKMEPSIINPKQGAIIKGEEIVAYLENQLAEYGMTASERADFITYWGPILQTKTNLYIYVLLDEACDAIASLDINPKPTNISRYYLIWTEVPSDYSPKLEPQEVPKMQREGFTVLEWGGVEIDAKLLHQEDL